MQPRIVRAAFLAFLFAAPLGAAAAPGPGDGGGGATERAWCKGGTILEIRDECNNLIGLHCIGGRDGGQQKQIAFACT